MSGWLLTMWGSFLVVFMMIGGYFMFRKFFKILPMADGKSKLDWQNYYVDQSRHLWTDESKAMLDKLVSPIPGAFRDIAKHSIAAKIGQLALERNAEAVTIDDCVKGYILATPKRDHGWLKKFLDKEGIDYQAHVHLLGK